MREWEERRGSEGVGGRRSEEVGGGEWDGGREGCNVRCGGRR